MLLDDKTRYSLGSVEYSHRGHIVKSSVGHPRYDSIIEQPLRYFDYSVGFLPPDFKHRPDKVSDVFYNTPGYWWTLMVINNYPDIFENFKPNDRILIPKI